MDWYLTQFGIPIAFLLMSLSALILYKRRHKLAAILIGISALTISALKILHELNFNQDLVTYGYDNQGQVTYATVELTLWQNISLWVDPIGIFLIAVGVFILARKM